MKAHHTRPEMFRLGSAASGSASSDRLTRRMTLLAGLELSRCRADSVSRRQFLRRQPGCGRAARPDGPLRAPQRAGHAPQPVPVGPRPRRRADDGEPLLRPPARLAAGSGRQAGRPDLRRPCRGRARHASRSLPTSRAAATTTRTTATSRAGSRTTAAGATAGSERARTTSTRSATTRQQDLAFLGTAAPAWTSCDR